MIQLDHACAFNVAWNCEETVPGGRDICAPRARLSARSEARARDDARCPSLAPGMASSSGSGSLPASSPFSDWLRVTRRRTEASQLRRLEADAGDRRARFDALVANEAANLEAAASMMGGQGWVGAVWRNADHDDALRELAAALRAYWVMARNVNLRSLWFDPHSRTVMVLGRPVQVPRLRPQGLSGRPSSYPRDAFGHVEKGSMCVVGVISVFLSGAHPELRARARGGVHALLPLPLAAGDAAGRLRPHRGPLSLVQIRPHLLRLVPGRRQRVVSASPITPRHFGSPCRSRCVHWQC